MDGGYVVPEIAVLRAHMLLSLGLAREWSFEKNFLNRNPKARLIGVDHTVGVTIFLKDIWQTLPRATAYFLVLDWSKGKKFWLKTVNAANYFVLFRLLGTHIRKKVAATTRGSEISINEIIKSVPTVQSQGIFIKMDIESSEYFAVPDIVRNEARILCVAAEFHNLKATAKIFNVAIKAMLAHYHIVHIHGNNFGSFNEREDFPDTVEITFLHKSLLPPTAKLTNRSYPVSGLDYPNDPRYPDYSIRFE